MRKEFERFYSDHLQQHGNSAQGVGWKNKEAQLIRFDQLIKVINTEGSFSINDLGCGTGDLIEYLGMRYKTYRYYGYDVMPEMIARARQRFDDRKEVHLHQIENAGQMQVSDFTIASGIFNIRFTETDDSWLQYILATLIEMDKKSVAGFSFNILTKYSDPEFMKAELYYADPCFLFDFCKMNFSRNVALLHDYNQYDFTIIVRKNF